MHSLGVHFFFEKFCGFGNLFYICVVKETTTDNNIKTTKP